MLIGSTVAAVGPAGATADAGSLKWKSCSKFGDEVQCATFTVPLDHSKPNGKKMKLAVAKIPARKASKKIGSLFFNVGGPGFGSIPSISSLASLLPRAVADRFDLVAWDPRGSGASKGIECGFDMDRLVEVDQTPDTTLEVNEINAVNQEFAQACEKKFGKTYLASIGTDQTIQDLDALRAAVGDKKLSYIGFSYGTFIAAEYAARYPKKVRAFVLDGPVDPNLSAEDSETSQRKGFQRAFDEFLKKCVSGSFCELGDKSNPREVFETARDKAERGVITATRRNRSGKEVPAVFTAGLFDAGVSEALYYGEDGYFQLSQALRSAAEGDGTELLSLADDYNQRAPDGTYGPELQSFQAIWCRDHGAPDAATWEQAIAGFATTSPDFGGSGLPSEHWCAQWPVPASTVTTTPVTYPSNLADIVVIAAKNDPATPLSEGKALADALPNSFLVVVNSAAHTNAMNGNRCVDELWSNYLITAKLPKGAKKNC